MGCNGGHMINGWTYIASAGGIQSEESYPYTAHNGHCQFQDDLIVSHISGYERFPPMRTRWRRRWWRSGTLCPSRCTPGLPSSTTAAGCTTTASASMDNSTTPSWPWDTTSLDLTHTGLSRTRGELAGGRTDTSK